MASGVKKNFVELKNKLSKTLRVQKSSNKYKVTPEKNDVNSTVQVSGSAQAKEETSVEWTDDLCILQLIKLEEEPSADWVTNREWCNNEQLDTETEKEGLLDSFKSST